MKRFAFATAVACVWLTAAAAASRAEESAAGARSPLREFLTRPTLTGDWLRTRPSLAEQGVTFDATVTQIGQGVVDGGKNDDEWQYGGRANLTTNIDTQKMGLWPGGFFTLELEGNWSNAVNNKTGALLPVNTNQLFPLPPGDEFGIPNLSFMQFFSPYAGVILGKLDTMKAGDANEFAHGKGDTQFLNLAFGINPVALVTPYSTLGGGLIVLPTKDPKQAVAQFLVTSASGKATTSGFDDIAGDNLLFALEGRLTTGFFDLTGHQLAGAIYSNRTYTSLDQRLDSVISGQLATEDDTWAVYYNFDQYLYEIDKEKGRGIGVFGRFGASKGQPNPVEYFFSFGLGGKGMFASREHDRFGLGYYYSIIENPKLRGPLVRRDLLEDEWGVELFYNVAITPWMLLTPDLQIIGPTQKNYVSGRSRQTKSVDVATVLGFRLQLIF